MRTVLVPENDLRRLFMCGVTMIGDSVHATPILGAKGANFVISDAVELAGVIEEHGTEEEAIERSY
jgi:2-polyprenyl-6-methoxyphenol hydroxylase-like FAD-dependent oxidoreductase